MMLLLYNLFVTYTDNNIIRGLKYYLLLFEFIFCVGWFLKFLIILLLNIENNLKLLVTNVYVPTLLNIVLIIFLFIKLILNFFNVFFLFI